MRESRPATSSFLLAAALSAGATLLVFWPGLQHLHEAWTTRSTYSHGYLAAPAALYLLWLRRQERPELVEQLPARALGILLIAASVQLLGLYFYFPVVGAWSLMIWLLALANLWGGWPLARWSLPALCLFAFAMPLPFSVETALIYPLQSLATSISYWLLILLGQPVSTEGHWIGLGRASFEVAPACSGLSLVLSMLALSYIYCFAWPRAFLERAALLVLAAPIAIFMNGIRIAATCWLLSGQIPLPGSWVHDLAGWVVVVLSVVPLAGVSWYVQQWLMLWPIKECEPALRGA